VDRLELWDEDVALSWALGSVPIGTLEYVPVQLDMRIRVFEEKSMECKVPLGNVGKVESWAYWTLLLGADVDNGAYAHVSAIKQDMERVVEALQLLDSMSKRWGKSETWKVLIPRLKYGIPKEMVPLVEVSGIGGKRARMLWDAGFRTVGDLADDLMLPSLSRVIGSPVVARKVNYDAKRKVIKGEV